MSTKIEHIISVEASEDTKEGILIDKDKNGSEFSLSLMLAYIYMPKFSDGTTGGYADYRINGAGSWTKPSSGWANDGYLYFEIVPLGDFVDVKIYKIPPMNSTGGAAEDITMWSRYRCNLTDYTTIKSFLFKLFNVGISAGTKIDIYGIRA